MGCQRWHYLAYIAWSRWAMATAVAAHPLSPLSLVTVSRCHSLLSAAAVLPIYRPPPLPPPLPFLVGSRHYCHLSSTVAAPCVAGAGSVRWTADCRLVQNVHTRFWRRSEKEVKKRVSCSHRPQCCVYFSSILHVVQNIRSLIILIIKYSHCQYFAQPTYIGTQ